LPERNANISKTLSNAKQSGTVILFPKGGLSMDGGTFGQGQFGQSGTGPQSNMGMSDRDIASDMLVSHKYVTELYNRGTTESASSSLRSTFQQIYNEMQDLNRSIWSYMNQRGWYNPMQADSQMVSNLRNSTQNLRQDIFSAAQRAGTFSYSGFQPGAGYGQAGSSGQATGTWSSGQSMPQWASGSNRDWSQSPGGQSGYGQVSGGMGMGMGSGNLPNWASQPARGEPTGGQSFAGFQSGTGYGQITGGGMGSISDRQD
jgi:spore coat protein CotF